MESKKQINSVKKNNMIAIFCGLFSVALVFYIFWWYNVYQEDNLNNAIISEHLNEISYIELQNYISENQNATIYIGIPDNEQSREYENIFKNIVENYDLNDKIVYVNLSDVKDDYLEKLNSKYETEKLELKSMPAIIKFEGGKYDEIFEDSMTKSNTIRFLKRNEIIDY